MKSDDDMFDETTVLLTWNDMRVINDIILTSKVFLFLENILSVRCSFTQSTSCENGRVHVKLLLTLGEVTSPFLKFDGVFDIFNMWMYLMFNV